MARLILIIKFTVYFSSNLIQTCMLDLHENGSNDVGYLLWLENTCMFYTGLLVVAYCRCDVLKKDSYSNEHINEVVFYQAMRLPIECSTCTSRQSAQ